MKARALGLALLLAVLYVGCGDDARSPSPAGVDASRDGFHEAASFDSASDATGDAPTIDVEAAASSDSSSLEAASDSAGSSDVTTDSAHSSDVTSDGGPTSDAGSENQSSSDAAAESTDSSDAAVDGPLSSDAGDDVGPSTACSVYCACMGSYCTSFPGYPYPSEASCFVACRAFTLEESLCFRSFCISAERDPTPEFREHFCQHAWGQYGLLEC